MTQGQLLLTIRHCISLVIIGTGAIKLVVAAAQAHWFACALVIGAMALWVALLLRDDLPERQARKRETSDGKPTFPPLERCYFCGRIWSMKWRQDKPSTTMVEKEVMRPEQW